MWITNELGQQGVIILDQFIYDYNYKRTNQGYRLNGKTPYRKFLDGKRKYALPEPS